MTIYNFFTFLGGIGLFLYGMTIMSTGLKNTAGEQLQVIIEHATSNRFIGFLIGIAITILIQSSSATDMMVIGFVNSGLMTLSQAIGVIMGANIGTTVTSQITAFDLSSIAPLILFIGILMCIFSKKSLIRNIGSIIMGFGMLFVGIAIIKETIAPLSQSEQFVSILSTLKNPALAILFGIVFTALLQSSSSSSVIFQTFAVQGLLTYDMVVYLLIGAAIGAVTPNLLASLATNRNGKRTAIINLLLNLFRAALLIILINLFPQILTFIQSLSPGNIMRQVANTHTIFAIITMLIELPFANQIVKLSQKILPVLPEEQKKIKGHKIQYLTKPGSVPPAIALSQAHMEIARMGHMAYENLKDSVEAFFNADEYLAQEVFEREECIDFLTQEITNHLGALRSLDLSERDRMKISQMTLAAADVERISDHAQKIVEYGQTAHNKKLSLSKKAQDDLQSLAKASIRSVEFCINIFENQRYDLLSEAEELENEVDKLQDTLIQNHLGRMAKNECISILSIYYTDMAIDLERCSDHAINIAKALSDEVIEHMI